MRMDGLSRRSWQGPRLYQSDSQRAMPSRRSRNGTVLNAPFTIARPPRYMGEMLLFAALAASAVAQPPIERPGPALVRQATATVRIVSGTRIRFGKPDAEASGTQINDRQVRESDGSWTPVTLVEFP